MTALFSERRRADELAAAIEDPQRDVGADLRALARLATSLGSVAAATPDALPRAEFAAELRARLMAEADEVMVPGGAPLVLAPRTGLRRRERRLVAAASVAVLVGGSAGMAAASQGALPGDPLYAVKRGIERAEVGLSASPAGKGRDLLQQASGRLTEVRGLLADDRVDSAPRVPGALADFVGQAQQGSDLLVSAFLETRDPAAIEDVRAFAADSVTDLEEIAARAPASAQDSLREAALALRDIDAHASAMCATCAAGVPSLEMPDVLLAAAEADRALTDLDARALDNSHPFVVPKALTPDRVRRATGHDGEGTPGGITGGVTGGISEGISGGTGPGTGGEPSTGSGTPKTTGPLPTGPTLPTPTIPGGTVGDDPLADNLDDVGNTVGGTVGDITDGLTGVVETVLPDPVIDPDLLP